VALAVAAAIALRRVEPFLRAQIVTALSQHFNARVELDSFHVSLVDGLEAEGSGLRIWQPMQLASAPGAPTGNIDPMIRLDEFRFRAPLRYRPGKPIEVRSVKLNGLAIHVPPRSRFEQAAAVTATSPSATASGTAAGESGGTSGAAPAPGQPNRQSKGVSNWVALTIDSVDCTNAQLVLETSKPGKLPLTFEIAHLKLTDISPSGTMKFDSVLTNPRPKGTITSTGSFGPWQVSDPGESPINGKYRFENADLASFKGIAGILSSTGQYAGTLRNLVVNGETDTPDFHLTNFGNALPLQTRFHAKVDGTDGDTWLDPVEATLGHSHFLAEGQIVRMTAGASGKLHDAGHDIALTVNVDKARIEDFLALVGKTPSPPLLTGDLTVKTTVHIPPATAPVQERMTLDGNFRLEQAEFTNAKIQDRIRDLSLRGQGHPGEVKTAGTAPVDSEMDGKFTMASGVITLPQLNYSVPGAQIELRGTYGLEGGALSFTGIAKMQATVSQMVGGWKGFLLKPADRFFKKDGAGTEVSIHISGTRENPDFGIDLGRMKSTSPEKPGAGQQ
jgi:hypothetical protein